VTNKVISLAGDLERFDPLHEARLLILLGATASRHPIDGIMKLAKMDFLVRYPKMLERALIFASDKKPSARRAAAQIPESAKDTVEGRMIRFRYGPWDKRYRRWLAVLAAKALVTVSKQGRTVCIALTPTGLQLSQELASRPEFLELAVRSDAVRLAVGDIPATRLKDLVYQIAPELSGMKWGESIRP
jgi:hypothetical protein